MISNRIRVFLIASAVAASVVGPVAIASGAPREPMPQRWCTNGTTGFYSNGDECPSGYN